MRVHCFSLDFNLVIIVRSVVTIVIKLIVIIVIAVIVRFSYSYNFVIMTTFLHFCVLTLVQIIENTVVQLIDGIQCTLITN